MQNGLYSWGNNVASTIEAIRYIQQNHLINGIVGMCTGGVIAVEALAYLGLGHFPLVLYNSSYWVGWQKTKTQDEFKALFEHIRLDREALKNAPDPVDIIGKHNGLVFQLLCCKSRYPISYQEKMKKGKDDILQEYFDELGDVPDIKSPDYQLMLNCIIDHFS